MANSTTSQPTDSITWASLAGHILSFFIVLLVLVCLQFIFMFVLLIPVFYLLYLWLRMPTTPAQSDQFRNLLIAHRGGQPLVREIENEVERKEETSDSAPLLSSTTTSASKIAPFPENTMSAFRWALEQPTVDAIEFDVWLSSDAVPVVCHDPILNRLFHGTGYVNDYSIAQLKKFRYRYDNHSDTHLLANEQKEGVSSILPSSEEVPTLEEVLELVQPKINIKIMLEVKELERVSLMCEQLVNIFKRHTWIYERLYVASFNPYVIYRMRHYDRLIITGFINTNHCVDLMLHTADKIGQPVSPVFRNCYILHWLIDSTLRWFATPVGLNFLGSSIACIQHRSLSLERIEAYQLRDIVLASWTVNDPMTKLWLQSHNVTVITDNQF